MVNKCACVCTCVFKLLSLKSRPEIKKRYFFFNLWLSDIIHVHPYLSKRTLISQVVLNISTTSKTYFNT